jgi:hypothetical protein
MVIVIIYRWEPSSQSQHMVSTSLFLSPDMPPMMMQYCPGCKSKRGAPESISLPCQVIMMCLPLLCFLVYGVLARMQHQLGNVYIYMRHEEDDINLYIWLLEQFPPFKHLETKRH